MKSYYICMYVIHVYIIFFSLHVLHVVYVHGNAKMQINEPTAITDDQMERSIPDQLPLDNSYHDQNSLVVDKSFAFAVVDLFRAAAGL